MLSKGRFKDIVLLSAIPVLLLLPSCRRGKTPADLASDALTRGLQAHVEGRVDDAEKAYKEVLKNDPNNKFGFYNLGLIDQERGEVASAERNYRQALALDPDFTPALYNLAIIVTVSDPAEAETLYRRVIAITPNDAAAHLNLGFLLKSQGKEAEGEELLDRAVELDPAMASRRGTPAPPPATAPSPSPTAR